jgi:inorganic phosphate transporter, PiT family
VMGVFLPENPLSDVTVLGVMLTANQLLFLVGGLAIAVGVLTYSERVMQTVGGRILRLSPEAALVVVLAHGLVLFVFASEGLEAWLAARGLPTIPLVPVSSSQAVIGAILGLGILRGGREIRLRPLGGVGLGWVATPVAAGLAAFFLLFFVDNVFEQQVARDVRYRFDEAVLERAASAGLEVTVLREQWLDRQGRNAMRLQHELERQAGFSREQAQQLLSLAEVTPLVVDLAGVRLDQDWFTPPQLAAIRSLAGRRFDHRWQLADALAEAAPQWRPREETPGNRRWNVERDSKLAYLERLFAVQEGP